MKRNLLARDESQTPIIQPFAYSFYRLIEVSFKVFSETSPKQDILIGLLPDSVIMMNNITKHQSERSLQLETASLWTASGR